MLTRRQFTLATGALAFTGLATSVLGKSTQDATLALSEGYGPLLSDPNKLIDLPAGFHYEVISELGDLMSDGLHVPDRADGMGCFDIGNNKIALVRNHELQPEHIVELPTTLQTHSTTQAYDSFNNGVALPGGTSTIVYNLVTQKIENQYLSLSGTISNCSGGTTPWNSWLTCEESVSRPDGNIHKDHGYVFEVPAKATHLVEPTPIKAMGRFNHEACAVDPKTGIVYMTEDRNDGLFYRYVPKEYGNLIAGGELQALAIKGLPKFNSSNWEANEVNNMQLGEWIDVQWITLDNPESPNDDLRFRGFELGATLFSRGEGVHWADNELYFCCTNGGKKRLGQIMRYKPTENKAKSLNKQTGKIQLFLESTDKSLYNFGDNLTVTPQGHLLVCEDQYTLVVDNHLRGVTPTGEVYNFARLNAQTELTGACFSPDGSTLFVNAYSPTKTLAIKGPWRSLS